MTKKSDQVVKLLKMIVPRAPLPTPMKEASLLEQGLLTVLVRHMSQAKAEAVIPILRKSYPDWNELRVAQTQEIAAQIAAQGPKAGRDSIQHLLVVAREVRGYLQEVFQKTHGLDLEFMRDDMAAAGKLVQQMPLLGLAGGSYLLWLAGEKQLPVHGALVRVLDRLGLIARTASMKKARDFIDPLVPPGEDLAFVQAFGEIADRWCDARKPLCHECVLVDECVFGKKAFQEWKVLQVRLEGQRVKEGARRALIESKEQARREREESRAAKKAAIEAAKKDKARQRQESAEAKKRAATAARDARLQAQQKKAAAAAQAAERAAKAKVVLATKKRFVPPAKKNAKSKPKIKIKIKSKTKASPARKPVKNMARGVRRR